MKGRRHLASLDDDIRDHLERETEDNIGRGMTPEVARTAARRTFGSVLLAKERAREVWTPRWLLGLGQDIRLAVRSLRRTPLVTAVAMLSLALGIGANTAIFSLVNSLLLRALPVRDPAALVLLKGSTDPGVPEWSIGVWELIREQRELFGGVAAYSSTARTNLTLPGDTRTIDGFMASGSFFETLGVPAALGRVFSADDDQRGGGPDGPVAVISYRFWQQQFQGASSAIGQPLPVENVPFTVVGVTPPDFFGPDVGRTFDVIVPLALEPLVSRDESVLENRSATWLNLIARLAPGQTRESATERLRAQQAHIFDITRPPWAGQALDAYLKQHFTLLPAGTGNSAVRGAYERPLLTILVVVALVLLIACANIANLLLARATARYHELSVRRALGASRWRLARQLFAESALIAVAGGGVGLWIAVWSSGVLVRQLSTTAEPVRLDLSMDWHVLAFTMLVTVATALLFGVAPALQMSRIAPADALKERGQAGGASGAGRRSGVANGLIVAQVALSLVLVVAAGLFVRSFMALATRDLGFDRGRVLIASINAHSASIEAADRLRVYNDVTEAVRRVPGVASAAFSAQTPPLAYGMILPLHQVSGGPVLDGRELGDRIGLLGFVAPGWFSAFGTPIASGRDFTDRDVKGAPRVAIVNQAFTRAFLNGDSPIGRTIHAAHPELDFDIVGVSTDAVFRSVRGDVQAMVFIPLAQATWAPTPLTAQLDLNVRASGGAPEALAKSVSAAIRAVRPDLALTFTPLAEQVSAAMAQERLVAILSGSFGALALLLSSLGLYGVTAYAVARRRAEIGIRMGLGAPSGSVVRLMLARVAVLVAMGVAVGAGVSLWASKFSATLLYGLEPRDPWTFAGATVLLTAVAAIAAGIPAFRASRIDPAVVLRDS